MSVPVGCRREETDRLQAWKVHFTLSNTHMQLARNAQLLLYSSYVLQAWVLCSKATRYGRLNRNKPL